MKLRIIFLLLVIILLSPKCFAGGNLQINEVMYDLKSGSDDGREWVEIYNTSSGAVDLSTFKFFEANANHRLTPQQSETKIPPLGYAVIVSDSTKFKADWPNFSGLIFDSTFSLNNTGEVLALKDGDTTVDIFTYKSTLGGAGDGNSLQKINGEWVGAQPTPGGENKIIKKPEPTTTTSVTRAEAKLVPAKIYKSIPVIPGDTQAPGVLPSTKSDQKSSSLWFLIIAGAFILASATSVYFLRRKKTEFATGDDFEILDE